MSAELDVLPQSPQPSLEQSNFLSGPQPLLTFSPFPLFPFCSSFSLFSFLSRSLSSFSFHFRTMKWYVQCLSAFSRVPEGHPLYASFLFFSVKTLFASVSCCSAPFSGGGTIFGIFLPLHSGACGPVGLACREDRGERESTRRYAPRGRPAA